MTPIHCTSTPTGATLRRGYNTLHARRTRAHRLSKTVVMALPIATIGAASLFPGTTDLHRAGIAGAPPAAAVLHRAALTSATSPGATTPGAVAAFGTSAYLGSPGAGLRAPAVAMARTGSGQGYWVATADGGVFSYGDATFHGSLGGTTLRQPIVGMAATPDGLGYWLVAADGGVFSFGDATFHGSTGGAPLTSPVVGMASPSAGGYWLATADGQVLSFGDAAFHGGLAGVRLARPVTAIAASPTGLGYWLAAADGGVFSFGDALYSGSLSPEPSDTAVVALAPGVDDSGYWAATAPVPAPPRPVAAASVATTGTPLGAFTVTCYDNHGRTATGAPTSTETVAVDPAVIPLGTTIDIAGVGDRVAEDTGGAVRGDHVDIWEPSAAACDEWGVQTRAVWRVR